MIWDPCLARAVAAELHGRLRGARARALSFRREAQEVVVYFRDATLVVDLAPQQGVVVLETAAEPEGDAEPLPAVLAEVEAVWDERIMVMRLRRVRDGSRPVADPRTRGQPAECNPRGRPDLRVRKRLRSVKGRPLRIGQPWEPPGEGGAGGGTA